MSHTNPFSPESRISLWDEGTGHGEEIVKRLNEIMNEECVFNLL